VDREVRWAESAARDLEQIAEYIAKDSPASAATVVREVVAAAASLSKLAEHGRRAPECDDKRSANSSCVSID
jgi:plasmid stabilization system protein ParE